MNVELIAHTQLSKKFYERFNWVEFAFDGGSALDIQKTTNLMDFSLIPRTEETALR
nr:hypothetical protein [Paenibacillus larvae]